MEPREESTLEDFQRWHVHHLKDYLMKRGLSKSGKKSELAALAYSCHVMKKPIVSDVVPYVNESFNDYHTILETSFGITIPDPFKIGNGWITETDNGMKHWPPLNIVDIIDFFRKQNVETEKLLSEYKAGKAYDYYKTEWLKEIHYNSLNQFSSSHPGIGDFCLLRAKCTPSQRIHDPEHEAWVCASKESGEILAAYCNCAAGYVSLFFPFCILFFVLSENIWLCLIQAYYNSNNVILFRLCQSCNHVAGLLFRVEAAVKSGLTNPTCTSEKATWVIPASKTAVSLTPISSLDIQVHKYGFQSKFSPFLCMYRKQLQ